MIHDISPADLKEILTALREDGNPRWKWIANQLEGVDITERLKGYDPPEEFCEYITRMCRYLRAQFHLEEWHGHIRFEELEQHNDPDARCKAIIKVETVYLYYLLRIGKDVLDEWREGEFEEIGDDLCHEFCHILTDPLCRLAKADAAPSQIMLIDEVNERQTQRIARIIAAALPDGWWKPEYLQRWDNRYGSGERNNASRGSSTGRARDL